MAETTFEKKCSILADLWLLHKDDETFEDFFEYNDLGLPLAYSFDNGIIDFSSATDGARPFVNEAFTLLLDALEMEDTGFQSLNEVFQLGEDE
jgi:hypothetical protein